MYGTFTDSIAFLFQGFRHRSTLAQAKIWLRLLCDRMEDFQVALADSIPQHPSSAEIEKIHENTLVKASRLSQDERFSFSILVPVYKPNPAFLRTALESALLQTAKKLEVIVGFDGPQPAAVYGVVRELKERFPNTLHSIEIDREKRGRVSATTNALAELAQGNFLLLMDHDDWMRPDLLFHYETFLREQADPLSTVLSCNEYKINEKGTPLPRTELEKPSAPPFPYVFNNYICHCLLIPKILWKKIGGLRSEFNGAQDYDLTLRLDLAGASFKNIPLYLYAWRVHGDSTAGSSHQKNYAREAGLLALKGYLAKKKRDWDVVHGAMPLTYRAIPKGSFKPSVHVFLSPTHKEKRLLSSVEAVQASEGVDVKITLFVEGGMDPRLKESLSKKGVSFIYLPIESPLSRARNRALQKERPSWAFLCLSPHVVLQKNALQEMCRWIGEPDIGMVGGRIAYPEGILCGGPVYFGQKASQQASLVKARDPFRTDGLRVWESTQGIADAPFRGCFLVKSAPFFELGGFDEEDPESEVDLALRLKERGFSTFYTPYAEGIYEL